MLGVCSDEDTLKVKGPPVLNENERAEIMRHCKWVDEVIVGTPYTISLETLDKYNC